MRLDASGILVVAAIDETKGVDGVRYRHLEVFSSSDKVAELPAVAVAAVNLGARARRIQLFGRFSGQ